MILSVSLKKQAKASKIAGFNPKPVTWSKLPDVMGDDGWDPCSDTSGREMSYAADTFLRYSLSFLLVAASTGVSGDSAARREAFMLDALAVLKGPVNLPQSTNKLMAVGRSDGSPGTGMSGKINASAGRDAEPKRSPLDSP